MALMGQSDKKAVLHGVEKAAALMLILGEELSAQIIKQLRHDEIQTLVQQIPKMADLSPDALDSVINEFNERIGGEGMVANTSKEFVENVINRALEPSSAEQILKQLTYSEKIDALRKIDPQTILALVKNEHPQTISLVLAHLTTQQQSEIISRLPEDLMSQVVYRMARMEKHLPGTLEDVIDSLYNEVSVTGGERTESLGGVKNVAEILNMIKKAMSNEIISKIEDLDPDLAEEISQHMFVFEDILSVDDRGVQAILKEVSNDDLALALKVASDELRSKIFKNVSVRAADMIQEEIEALGPVKISEVEKSQQMIVRIARKLEEEGKVVVSGRGDDIFV